MDTTFLDLLAIDAQLICVRPDITACGFRGFLHHLSEMPGENHLFVLVGEGGFYIQHVTACFGPREPGSNACREVLSTFIGLELLRSKQSGEC